MRVAALVVAALLVAGALPAVGQVPPGQAAPGRATETSSAGAAAAARSLAAVIGDSPNHPLFVGVVIGPRDLVALTAYVDDPVSTRVAAAFAGAPNREAAREGTVVCVSAIAAGMDRTGQPFEWGVARIHLDEPVADGVHAAPLGGGLHGPLVMIDVRSRSAEATVRGDRVPLTGFGEARFPILVSLPEARRLDLFSAVFDARQRLAGFALPYAGEAARGDIAFVSLEMPRTECLR